MSQIRYAAVCFLLTALFSPSSYAGDPSGLKKLDKALKRSASQLSSALRGKTCVLDLSEAGDLSDSSEFGQTAATLLATHLSGKTGKKFSLTSRYDLLKIMRDSAVFGDPDTVQRLSREAGMDTLVSGEYSGAASKITLTLKAVEAKTGKILKSVSVMVDNTADMEKMMSRKFRQMGAPPDEPASGKDVIEAETGVYFEGGDGKLYPLREGMVLTADDNYALYFRARQDCYLYVFQADSANILFRLFPNGEYSSLGDPVHAGTEMWIPQKGFLFLDNKPGKEEIMLFASRTPLSGAETVRDGGASIDETIRLMGVGGRRGSEALGTVTPVSGKPLQVITRKMIADGGFYYRLSFIHR